MVLRLETDSSLTVVTGKICVAIMQYTYRTERFIQSEGFIFCHPFFAGWAVVLPLLTAVATFQCKTDGIAFKVKIVDAYKAS